MVRALVVLLAGLGACQGPSLGEPGDATPPPNVLFIVSEDNGPELGCYGDPYARTPTLDAMAKRGVRFARAFVPYSVCSPSRACFLTGLWPQQNGHLGLATHRFALYGPMPSLPSLLKERGYRTGIIGKLHVNPARNFPFDFRAIPAANFHKRNVRAYAAKAQEFLAQSAGHPWFLQVNYPDAHYPLHRQQFGLPEQPLDAADVRPLPFVGADSPRLREFTANYYNCMERLDRGVGMLLDVLTRSGERANTLVIYIGDHGAQFSRGKCSVYEAGLRVPMILDWPGKVQPRVVEQLTSTLDILPTLLAVAGPGSRPELPGRSLWPLVRGERVDWRQHVFGITTGAAPGIDYLQFSVRDDRYKLIWNPFPAEVNQFAVAYREHRNVHFKGGTTAAEIASSAPHVRRAYATFERPPEFELYDLREDPHEFRNQAALPALAGVRRRLFARLRRWQQEICDPLSEPDLRRAFVAQQIARRDGAHRKRGFRWSYLDVFRSYRESKGGRR